MLPSISAFQRLGSWGLLKHNYAPVAMRVLVTTSSLCKCLSDSLRFAALFLACWKEQWHTVATCGKSFWSQMETGCLQMLISIRLKSFDDIFIKRILYLFDWFSLLRLSLRQDQTARMAPGRSCRCQKLGNWGIELSMNMQQKRHNTLHEVKNIM